jgi:uncharacterized protein YcbX
VAARVARISIAPVKSLGLVHPEVVEVGLGGVAGDRRFWLVGDDGRLVNGKRAGRLVSVRPDWDEAEERLSLSFPDGETVSGRVELGEPVEVELFGQPHPSHRVVGPWEEALSRFAGRRLGLLRSQVGAVDRGVGGGAVSLVSRGSLERLAAECGAGAPVDGRRFRMLFEIDRVPAHEEDAWLGLRVQVGAAVVELIGDVGRCAVTTHDPDRGVPDLDTLGALARYRREGRTERLPFGVHGAVVSPGRVRVGDPVGPLTAT